MGEKIQKIASDYDRLEALLKVFDKITGEIDVQQKHLDTANNAGHLFLVIMETLDELGSDINEAIRTCYVNNNK